MKILHRGAVIALALIPMLASAASQGRLEDLTVLALGALEGRAVVKTPDGKMQVLKVGDTIANTQAVVTQVLGDKIVVEEPVTAGGQTKRQVTWISKATKPGAKSVVQRLDAEGPPSKIVQLHVMQPVSPSVAPKKK
jgi:hypothetical protein